MAIQVNSPNNRTYVFSGSRKITPGTPYFSAAQTQISNFMVEIKRNNGQVLVGDAKGIDALVAAEAAKVGVPIIVMGTGSVPRDEHKQDFGTLTKGFIGPLSNIGFESAGKEETESNFAAYTHRDQTMVDRANVVVAIWDGSSTGTKNTFDDAVGKGKTAYLFNSSTNQYMVQGEDIDGFPITVGRDAGIFWSTRLNLKEKNREFRRDIWEESAAALHGDDYNSEVSFASTFGRFQTTIKTLNEAYDRLHQRFSTPFVTDNENPSSVAVSGLRESAFNQRYDPAWNSIGGFSDPTKSNQQLKWRGGSGTFSDMLRAVEDTARANRGSFTYEVKTDNYGTYVESVYEVGKNRFYMNTRYNEAENVWMTNTGTTQERVHTDRFSKNKDGHVTFESIGHSLFDSLTNVRGGEFVKGFVLPSQDRAQTFIDRRNRMILGSSLSEDLQSENISLISQNYEHFIQSVKRAGIEADFNFGELQFMKGKAGSFNPPSLVDVTRRNAGTSSSTEKDYVRRSRDKALGLISFNGEVPELEWRSKVLFGTETPLTGTSVQMTSIFNPYFFGEGMAYTVGNPQLVEFREVAISPEAPIRNQINFDSMKPGFLEINQTMRPHTLQDLLGKSVGRVPAFVFGIFNRGLNDEISSSSMAMAQFHDARNGEIKPYSHAKFQMVPLSEDSPLHRVTGGQMITMSPIKGHRFVDETVEIWRSNSSNTLNEILEMAVRSGRYKTMEDAKRAFYDDSRDGLIELIPTPDGKDYIPRFARESQWQLFSGLAALAWRGSEENLKTATFDTYVQNDRVDVNLKRIGHDAGIDISYNAILSGKVQYNSLKTEVKDKLSQYGIKGWTSDGKGVKFQIESSYDTTERIVRGQRVKANTKFGLTEMDIDILEAQQPAVAKLIKEMYGEGDDEKVRKYHLKNVLSGGHEINLDDTQSERNAAFRKAGGIELNLGDTKTMEYLNVILASVNAKSANLSTIKKGEKERVAGEISGGNVGIQIEDHFYRTFGPAFLNELKKALGTTTVAIHSGTGRATIFDLSSMTGKEPQFKVLYEAIRTGATNNISAIEFNNTLDPVSKVGRIEVAGFATRAASAKVPAGVVVVHEETAIEIINKMPISAKEKRLMIKDLQRGVPLEGIVRVQNFDRIAGFDNQAVYTYEQAKRLWPGMSEDVVTTESPVRVSELLPAKGNKDMDGDNLQLLLTSRRHFTASQKFRERRLGTPYREGALEQSVGKEYQDIEAKVEGVGNSEIDGHAKNLEILRGMGTEEGFGKATSFLEKAFNTAKGVGQSLRDKFYANVLMGHTYTAGTVIFSGMAQNDKVSGRNRFSPEQRFSMMHLPSDWYQQSMDLVALRNEGVISVLNTRNMVRKNRKGEWQMPEEMMDEDTWIRYKQDMDDYKKAKEANVKGYADLYPNYTVSKEDLSDFVLKRYLQISSMTKDMNRTYKSMIGDSSLGRELAYMMLPKDTSDEHFANLTALIQSGDQSGAFDLIKSLSGKSTWLSGNSPMARYATNVATASSALNNRTVPYGDESFGVMMSLLSRDLKRGEKTYSNDFLLEVVDRASKLSEYKDSALLRNIQRLTITKSDREEAEPSLSSYDRLKAWAEGNGSDDNIISRTVRSIVKSMTGLSNRFSDGGFTGIGGKFDFAGIVHKGEYVITKEKVNHIRAGGGDAVMKEIAKELGATAFMSGAGSYWGGGYVGYAPGGLVGQGLYQGAYPLPRTGQIDQDFMQSARTPQATVQGLSVPRGQGIVVDKSVKGRDGSTVTYQEVMTPIEIEEYAQKRMSQVDTGRAFQGAQYLEDVSRGSLPFADFSLVTDEELLSRQWGAASSAVAGLTKKGRATGKLAATRQAAHGGQRMSDLDWAFSVMAKYGEVTSPEQWSALSESEQIMVREAVGIAHEIESSTTQAMQAGKLDARTARNMSQVVMTPAGASVSTRNVELGAFDEMFKNLGVSALSPVAAYEAQIGAQTKLTKEGALDAQSISQTVTGLQAMNKNLSDMSVLLPKVNDGHKMYVKQAEESLAIFRQAEQQINALTKPGAVLNTEQQTTLALLRDKSVLGGQSIEDYIKSNKSTFDDLENRVLQRRMSDALKQPYADTTPEERSDMLTQLLMGAGSRAGKARLAKERSIGLGNMVDDEGGLSIMGGLINLKGEGAQDAYGKFLRGFNAMNNASTVWAMRSISSMIINPALESAAAYEKTSANIGRSMYSSGLMGYDDLMGGQYGTMIRRQQRRELGQYAYGQAVYGAYAPLLDMFMSPEVAQSPLGVGAAIGVPAVGAGLIAQSVLGKAGLGMLGGLPVGALIAGGAAIYGLGATMGQAATDVGAMAQGGFYGSLGVFGSNVKTGLSNLGLAPSGEWAYSAENARMSEGLMGVAYGVSQGRFSSAEALQNAAVLSRGGQGLFNFLGETTGSGISQFQADTRATELAISGVPRDQIVNRLIEEFYPGVSRTEFIPGLGMSINEALETGAISIEGFEGTNYTNADLQQIGASLWARQNAIPFTDKTMEQTVGLYSGLSMYGLSGNSSVSQAFAQFVGTGTDPTRVLTQIAAPFSPTSYASIGLAISGQTSEYNRILQEAAAEGIKMSPEAAMQESALSSVATSNASIQQMLYGSATGGFTEKMFTDMRRSFGGAYTDQASANFYGFELQRGLATGSIASPEDAVSLYFDAVKGGDLRSQQLLSAMPNFATSARTTRAGSSERMGAMESAWRTGAERYGMGDAGLSVASQYYSAIDTFGMTKEEQIQAFTDLTDSVVKLNDSMISVDEGFQNWMQATGTSFSNAYERQQLFAQFTGDTGLKRDAVQAYTGVAGAMTAQYAGISRLMGGQMPSFDFSSIRDRALGNQMMGFAQSAADLIYSAPGSATEISDVLSMTMAEMKASPQNAMRYSREALQGMQAMTMFDVSDAFGFDTKNRRTSAYNEVSQMTPAQYSIFKAAAGGDQMAQSMALSGTQFEGITPFDLSSGVALGRYETGFSAVDFNTVPKREDMFLGIGLDYFGGMGGAAGMMEQFKNTGIRGMQYASAMASYNAAAAQYGYSTLGRNINLAMTVGGAQIDPITGFSIGGSNAGAERLFSRLGMDFMPGNGMTYWQIEDAQVQQQRERQQFQLAQQGQSIALSWDQFNLTGRQYGENEAMNYRRLGMSDRQFKESMSLRKEQFEYGVGYTQQEMTIGRGIQQTQEQWRGEDLAYNRNMMEVQFGFQMRDYNRNIRYARGRERLDLMRHRDDATVLYSMQAGQADRQETRHKTEMGWSADEFKRKEENFKKTTAYQRAEFALQEKHHNEQMKFSQDELKLQRKHFEESRELEKKRLEMQGEAHAKELEWLAESIELDNQKRLLDRQGYLENIKIQQLSADAAMGAQTRIKDLNLAMMGLREISVQNNAELKTMAYTNMPEYLSQLTKIGDKLSIIAGNLTNLLGFGEGNAFTGGFMGGDGFIPQMADGGPTPPGLTMQSTGLVGLHAGEYVVPQKGTLAIRGDNPETIALLREIRDELVELRKMGPGRVNAQIYTNEKSLDTGMLVNAAYTTRKQ